MPRLEEIPRDKWMVKEPSVEVLNQIRYVQFKQPGNPMGIYEVKLVKVVNPLDPAKAMSWCVKIIKYKEYEGTEYNLSSIEECFSWK